MYMYMYMCVYIYIYMYSDLTASLSAESLLLREFAKGGFSFKCSKGGFTH